MPAKDFKHHVLFSWLFSCYNQTQLWLMTQNADYLRQISCTGGDYDKWNPMGGCGTLVHRMNPKYKNTGIY